MKAALTGRWVGSEVRWVVPRAAVFSPDRLYRYRLSRRWSRGGVVLWVMLNPSAADERVDDPTIRRCIGFSRAWGFGGMEVVNLFGLRTPRPRDLARHSDPIGPDNDRHIQAAAARARRVVVAWGASGLARQRGERIRDMLGGRAWCIGTTRNGQPRHPLYTRAEAQLLKL